MEHRTFIVNNMDDSVKRQPSVNFEGERERTIPGEQRIVLCIPNLDIISDVMPEPRPGPGLVPYDGDLESVVECPVCLVIPRDLPIPSCPAGQCCHQASDDDDHDPLQVTSSASPAEAGCCIVQPADANLETTRAVWPQRS